VFNTDTENVAHERDFYRLQEMSEHDLAVVKRILIDPLPPMLRELAEGWIPAFTALFEIRRRYEASGQQDPEIEAELNLHINNLEEDLHARLESQAVRLLAALRNGDASLFDGDDEGPINHTWFIAAQYFRTPGMLANVTRALKDDFAFNVEAAFGLMRTIMSNNVGYALWARRTTLRTTFLRADGGSAFITGDQPILNTRAVGLAPGEEAKSLELYYPLSPNLALLLDFDAGARTSDQRTLTQAEVTGYNQTVVAKAYKQIFGANRSDVEDASGALVPRPGSGVVA
jgi:hypothetical protein